MTAAKNDKNDLRVGCCSTTTPADSQGSPGIQGCSLRKIERKIRWSVGYEHPENKKNGPESWML
jgi:hypothetical protein